jgi:methylmalonyl-CoA mutase N-terminal domain/subunit
MPTRDPVKNLEYVKKSQARKKDVLGVEEYNKMNASTEKKHRDKLKETMGIDEYKKQQAEYMKEYRARQKLMKQDLEKKQKSLNTLTDAIRARKARMEIRLNHFTFLMAMLRSNLKHQPSYHWN